ncbi:DNA polymerase iota-like [Daphnia carinata]|uniref:DNA polymerase iota-like n=1 Tax=Daphnia carinata TaxID=120202 RepID=UPI00257C9F1E|nr:DNA polymerase iota-like [Daphnia carinata]XP_057374365.1 DNA polymerase iota-like [Daphnia carinata]XP_057374366.1 DNA polymerase iota-like [Daphnia carinata]
MEEEDGDHDFLFSAAAQSTDRHERVIVHIDIDCYYAQVEMILNPSLRGKPLGIKQKNLVVTCNYEARALGVEKLMTIKSALEKCPSLILANGEDLKNYREMSEKIYKVLQSYSPFVEKLGLDENFVDVTHKIVKSPEVQHVISGHTFHDSEDICTCGCTERLAQGSLIAQKMRDHLRDELGITSCGGIAFNKLLAKLVGTTHKPNQQTTLLSTSSLSLIKSLKHLRNIPGIGSAINRKLEVLGINTIEKLQSAEMCKLTEALGGKTANQIQQLSFGIDNSHVKITDRPKSIGAEDGFIPIRSEGEVRKKLSCLLNRVLELVEKDGRKPCQLKLTVRKLHPSSHSVRESRQTTIEYGTGTGSSTQQGPGDEKQKMKLMTTLMNLFERIIDCDVSWQVTLLGISFSGFSSGNSESPAKNSINKYFPVKKSPLRSEEPLPPSKRCRFDESVLQELPPDIRQEVLEDMQNQLPSPDPQKPTDSDCPKGVDPLVFCELPVEIREELLAEERTKKQTTIKKSNNLLQYFRKAS